MKQRNTIAILMLLVCLSTFGQQPKSVPMQGQPQKTSTQVATNQQEHILQLQAENEAMQKKLEKMEKEVELYRGDVRAKEVAINDNQGHWLTLLSIVIGAIVSILGIGLGVITPIVLNARNDKRLKESYERMLGELKTQINSVEKDAKSAKESLSTITGLKAEINNIKKEILKSQRVAERAAKRTTAIKYFAQALSEEEKTKAIELYSKAIDIIPDNPEPYINRGILKEKIGDNEGAMKDFNKAIELNPNGARAYLSRGLMKEKNEDKDGAMKDFDKAIEIDSKYVKAYINRGSLKEKIGDERGALKDYDKAIELEPSLCIIYLSRGLLKEKIGDKEGALKDYDKAIEQDKKEELAYVTRGILKEEIGDKRGALKDYNKAIVLNPDKAYLYNFRADLRRRIGELEKGMEDINIAIGKDNKEDRSYVVRGEIYMAMNKPIEAIHDFSHALTIKDSIKDAYEGRAQCYRKLAEVEQDPAKKADLIAKAEADEKKAESLKKGDKA